MRSAKLYQELIQADFGISQQLVQSELPYLLDRQAFLAVPESKFLNFRCRNAASQTDFSFFPICEFTEKVKPRTPRECKKFKLHVTP